MKAGAVLLISVGLLGLAAVLFHDRPKPQAAPPPFASDRSDPAPESASESESHPPDDILDQTPVETPHKLSVTLYGSADGTPQARPGRQHKDLPFDPKSTPAWEAKYANSTITQLDAARNAIDNQIAEIANPILTEMLKDGGGTLLGPDTGSLAFSAADSRDISMMHVERGVGVYRATLQREEYPELYQLKDESLWLEYMIVGRFRQAASGKPSHDR